MFSLLRCCESNPYCIVLRMSSDDGTEYVKVAKSKDLVKPSHGMRR